MNNEKIDRSTELRQTIVQMKGDKMTVKEIAVAVSRPVSTVFWHLKESKREPTLPDHFNVHEQEWL